MRYGYRPDDQCPDYGDGRSWGRAIALHHRTIRARSADPLPGCAVPAASWSGESRHLAGSHGTAVRPGLATNDEPRR